MINKEKYFEIINNGLKDKPESGYYEHHHIVPKSICPLLRKSQDNLVYLTAKNHFLAHYYIWKWFRDELNDKKWAKKMCFAFNCMKRIITKSDDIDELSKLYEDVRKDFSKVSSEANKGKNNPMYGKDWRVGKSKEELEEYSRKMSHIVKNRTEETRKKAAESNKKPILQYTKYEKFIKEWKSARDVENELNINNGDICKCCQGKLNSAGGYRWYYKEDCLYFF